MTYSSEPSKVLVLSPDSSNSILIIWFATLSAVVIPLLVNPKLKKSATSAEEVSVVNSSPVSPKSNSKPMLSVSDN